MKTRTRVILAVLLTILAVFAGQSRAQEMGRYIVHTTGESTVNEAARQGVEARAGRTLKELPTGTGLVVTIPEVALEHMKKIPGVVAVEPDVVLTAVQALPWGVDRIDADLVWSTTTGSGVNIAIIDTGIDKDHPDLAVAGGRNFVRKGRRIDPDKWDDDNGHGTHCAGIAAALDNDIGVIGVAPGANLIAVKVLDRSGSGYLSDIMDGIYWAADNADVINLSLGIDKETLDNYPADLLAFETAVNYASGKCVVVAAAGNEYPGEDTVIYPARFESAIAVSATDSYDNLASFSSTGPDVELSAPGVGIYSTVPGGGYDYKQGTSMASPHVAGVVALMIYANVADVRGTLAATAEDLGYPDWDPYYGHGLVDAAAAADVSEEPVTDIAITVLDAPTSILQGDLASVDVTVENVGNQDFTSDIVVTLTDNGATIGPETISGGLAAGASFIVSFSWNTTGATLGDHTLTASHDFADDDASNDSLSAVVTVESAVTDIAIAAVTAPSSVVQGDVVTVDVTVENVGNQDVTSDSDIAVTLTDNGATIGTKIISDGLAAGAYATLTFNWDTSGASLDEHTLIASHDFIDGDLDNILSTTVMVTEAGDEMFMHVESIVIELLDRTAGRNTFTKALATVTIDASDGPVEGATVYGHWSGATSDSDFGVTNSSGEVTLESDAVKNAGDTEFIFIVDDVVKSGWTYTPES